MSDPNTIRILSFDGGGERGYLSLNFFQKFVQLWGIDPTTIAQQFDVICGTSVGGIMALSLAFGKTPDELAPFFTSTVDPRGGPYIFSLTSLIPSVRPNLATKIGLILADTPFYQSSGSTADQYGSGLLASNLQNQFGSNTLQDLKTNVIIPSYNSGPPLAAVGTGTYVMFSNLNYPDFIGQNALISDVALATGSAPIYLPPATLTGDPSGDEYIDGGVYQNNPASFGRTLAQMIKPTANRACVLSLGTGIGEIGFDPGNPSIIDSRVDPKMLEMLRSNTLAFDSIQTIFALFGIAATGGQESVAKALSLESSYTLDQLYYYRFQPMLDPNLNTELDNTDPEILTYYENTATDYFNEDIENISNFIGHLTV